MLCMAVMIRESEKQAVTWSSQVYLEPVDPVDDYFRASNTTVFTPTSPPPTGYLASIIEFLILVVCVVGNQLLEEYFNLALYNVFLPLFRIASRWSLATITSSWRRVRGWRSLRLVTGGDAANNTGLPADTKINESSQSEPPQVAAAVPDDVDNNNKIDESSRSATSQVAIPVPKDPNSETSTHEFSQPAQPQTPSATSEDLGSEKKIGDSSPPPPSQATTASATADGPANEHEVDKPSQSAVQQTKAALSGEDDVWINDEDSEPSSARNYDHAPMSSTREEVLAAFRTRKDKRTAISSKPAKPLSTKTANLSGRKISLVEELRRTLDPKSVYSNSNVLVIARDMKRSFKRINNQLIRQKRALAASQAQQENVQLRQTAIENIKLSTANKRLERRALTLEMGKQSAVTEVRNTERAAAWQREQRLVREKNAANDRASNAISQANYDSLRRSFDILRDQLNEAQEGRKAAVDELRAEQAKTETLAQQGSESTAAATTVPSEDRVTPLEQEALAREEAVQDAEARAQEAKTRAQESEVRSQEADTNVQKAKAEAEETETKLQEANSRLQEAEVEAREAESKRQEAEDRVQSATIRAQEAEHKAQNAEDRRNALQQELGDRNHQLEQRLQMAEEALKKAGNEAKGPSNQELYQQGYAVAVRLCEAEAQKVLAREVEAAIKRRDEEVLIHFNTQVENAVSRAKGPLQDELDAANGRATTAKAVADKADAALREAQSSRDSIQEKATNEWQRAQDLYKVANDEYHRAEKAEKEVEKYKTGKVSQDQRIRGYLDDISRLKKLIPANAALAISELESATRDRQRAQALLEESAVRSYCWDTKQVLKKLLEANEKIIELECTLKDPKTQSNQTEFLKVLQDAEVDQQQYMGLNLPMRQVLVKQCRAVNARLNDLRTAIKSSERPRKEGLLFEIYKVRGDEEAYYDEDDPESPPSSDEDEEEDKNMTNSQVQQPAPRRVNLPTSRRARPATVPQVAQIPLPADPRVHNDLKRKGFPNDEEDAEPQVETTQMAGPSHQAPQQASLSPKAADDSTQRTEEASSAQQQSFDPANLDPLLAAISPTPIEHHATPSAFASPTPPPSSHLEPPPQPKPTRIPGPRQKPQLSATERQERLRWVPNPESEATSAEEAAPPPTSIPGPTNFSFSMPKNIATGIRPHVRKYTQLSGMTNIVRSRRASTATDTEP